MIVTDLRGTFLSMKYELRYMTPFGQGSIVNIASGADLVGVPGFAGYAAAKHGQVGLTKATALDYGPQGNAIAAGLVDTPLVATGRPPEVMAARIAAHPIGRIGRPEEIADVVACYPAGTLLALILHLSALWGTMPLELAAVAGMPAPGVRDARAALVADAVRALLAA
jgi:NAD(P)-dependent dehydrogenase (short-subunit alcohol dehydrogenase family)